MRKLLFCCTLFIIAPYCILKTYAQDIEQKMQLSLSTGHQQEDFHWSIAGNSNGQSPNILSELKWKNISGTVYNAALQWNVWRRFVIYADYSRSAIKSGAVSDIDYNGDNRTDAIYNENFSDNKGNTSAWSAGAGYIIFNNSSFSLIPYAGYTNSLQNLYLVNLTGQFPGLNSSYQTKWKGAFFKLTSSVKIWHKLKAIADITYNQVNYNSKGDWNLIDQFQHPVSYRQAAQGYGINTNIKLVYAITRQIAIFAGFSYFSWETGNGNDTLYLTTGENDKTQFNGAVNNGFNFVGGLTLSR